MTEPTSPPPFLGNELTPQDLSTYTLGRMAADDVNTANTLTAALQEIRNYCRWHVCPIKIDHQITLDGPGEDGGLAVGIGGMYYASGSYMSGSLRHTRPGAGRLYLPTKNLQSIKSIVENGEPLDMANISFSRRGEVVKTTGQPWARGFQSIQVTFSHGYAAEDAIDWRRIVLNAADRMSMVRGLVGPFNAAIGPHRLSAYYGTSRTGNMPKDAGWLDDLTGMIDHNRYVRLSV